ncbi:uncharacterized protein LAESUDRAFT_814845 [Laetiporus sulphureus 93-53]|uniref:Uncharacterized protein n=1 Tax=Laetiporus sulphureus 93-53 TaxID=1314785 RepID=A0A165CPW7_9APHY|nr:uncharacterized protein LAESUDRAFT_814845 [Laetiporus sulphureus 93-53]KZT03204.1 hypothetical protein LAESUDRAFT_814845 [Laetiporus sulphureus 93-53]
MPWNTYTRTGSYIARRYQTGIPAQPIIERKHIMATLTWASLNAHYGIDFFRRDDLNSFADTVLFLLRGDLPWRKVLSNRGTVIANMLQVREQKKMWTGIKLAEGYFSDFDELLDYSHSWSFEGGRDYSRFLRMLTNLYYYYRSGFADDDMLDWSPSLPEPSQKIDIQGPIVTAGQMVYVEVLADLTIQGIPKLNDSYIWYGPSSLRDEWLFRRGPLSTVPSVRIARYLDQLEKSESAGIRTPSAWHIPDAYRYAFAGLNSFIGVDDQPLPAVYQVDSDMIKLLEDTFTAAEKLEMQNEEDAKACESIRETQAAQHVPHIRAYYAFTGHSIETAREEWFGTRGWLDGLVQIGRCRAAGNGWAWTGTPEAAVDAEGGGSTEELSDSYYGFDLADWELQGEHDISLTLSSRGRRRCWMRRFSASMRS